jgi:hypothetical protein
VGEILDSVDSVASSSKRSNSHLSHHAVASAERAEEKEVVAGYEALAALREALFGNSAEARGRARKSMQGCLISTVVLRFSDRVN